MSHIRLTVDLTGILQGVGFRPTLARAVNDKGFGGWVRNQSGTVRLSLCGEKDRVKDFIKNLKSYLPTHARLESVHFISSTPLSDKHQSDAFTILDSKEADKIRISIPADLATCEHCKDNFFDKNSRYYHYPFVTCTNCGPRYTVVDKMPYDRENTTLRDFPLCDACKEEYTDSFNRRFHAESIACPDCGPSLSFVDADGKKMGENDSLFLTRKSLSQGNIIAIKGLGGFHLAVDPFNIDAVSLLRNRKNRPDKPFAVMAKNIEVVKKYCQVTQAHIDLLSSSIGPIVILDLKDKYKDNPVFNLLSPLNDTLGVMLPTTPLHHGLFIDGDSLLSGREKFNNSDMLVMTSGNKGGEPICTTNDDAFEKLGDIVDYFLIHNRDINFRCDDSIVRLLQNEMRVVRRARGFAPMAVRLGEPIREKYLAMGADMKNSVSLGFNGEIVISPHIGDLESLMAVKGLEQVVDSFPEYFKQRPDKVLIDHHFDMQSSKMGIKVAKQLDVPVVKVQHHHAHAAACMGEYGVKNALALVFDGTGFGLDDTIWGGELLHVYPGDFKRLGKFKEASLIGGDAAVRNPVRQLVGRWIDADVDVTSTMLDRIGVESSEYGVWKTQCNKGLNRQMTSAAGRLFDAFSVALGVCPNKVTFEGQAAIWLESIARRVADSSFVMDKRITFTKEQKDAFLTLNFEKSFLNLLSDPVDETEIENVAMSVHHAVIDAGVSMALHGREVTGNNSIVLAGGVMMNKLLTDGLNAKLRNLGFKVYIPSLVPVNDGGISFGQIYATGEKKL